MTKSPQVPAVKHLLESKQRGMHILKKPSQSHKIQSLYISFPFINKIEQKSSKSFQQKTSTIEAS
jgi:hypothetical protein